MKLKSSLVGFGLVGALCGVPPWTAAVASGQCVGDCGNDNEVTVEEIIAGVNIALRLAALGTCAVFDANRDGGVTVEELILAVANALLGCGSPGNDAPQASDLSLSANASNAYVEKQLIGRDPDNDTITYELTANETGPGYSFAHVNPRSGVLYLTLTPNFRGMIVLPYRVTDGRLFSNSANVTIQVQTFTPSNRLGSRDIDPRVYASYPRGYYSGDLLGAPGADPTLPTSVDLSKDFPRPGDQGQQGSCVGWSVAYALKSYQERVEIGWSLEPQEHRFSPAYIYNQINGGMDGGSLISDAMDLVVNQGVASLARMPYTDQNFTTQPSNAARQEAAQFKGKSWKTANGTMEIKDALANRLPVVVGVTVFEQLQSLQGPNSVYNTFSNFKGGHAVTLVGYDDNRFGGAFLIINSWSQNWGDQGYFWLPYAAANEVVNTPSGETTVLKYAYVLEDLENTITPPPDPVDPPLPSELPNLEVTDWTAEYDGTPGGAGSLQWTVTNVGTATAPAGVNVSLVLSPDANFTASDTYVVYEEIPFQLEAGENAFRDEGNFIEFNFPGELEAGEYFAALWVDDRDDVVESNEDDNLSPADSLIEIVNTLPDLEVLSWYTVWDLSGDGFLTYDVINNGASRAHGDWLVTFALTPNEIIGDGDEIFLFGENADFELDPGDEVFRDDSSPGTFSLFFDFLGDRVPVGVYYLALWLDPDDSLRESNEDNNASFSWGTVGIGSGSGLRSQASSQDAVTSTDDHPIDAGEAYNGKILPSSAVRKVRISETADGSRKMEFLDKGAGATGSPRVKPAEARRRSKWARARQQVIFPVVTMKPMPKRD